MEGILTEMNPENSLTQRMEHLDLKRTRNLAWFLGSFLVWSFCSIVLLLGYGIFGGYNRAFTPVLIVLLTLPLAVWLFFLGRYLWIQRRIKADPQIAEALNDEMVRSTWFRAAAAGFWSMLAVEVVFTILRTSSNLMVGMGFVDISILYIPDIRSPLAIAVGVGVTIGVYLHHRRD